MGQQVEVLSEELIRFITRQKLFFVGTATADSRVNVSPKGRDALRVLDERHVIWLNLTGSGNETAAHVQACPRMTLMFCAFEGKPRILRLYGTARMVQHGDPGWETLYAHFEPLPGARQIFELTIELVQTSCGMAVPRFAYQEDRLDLDRWALDKGPEGVQRYWRQRNRRSIDGQPAPIPPSREITDPPGPERESGTAART